MSEAFEVIVIGAGDAGALVALRAANEGKRTALIYQDPYGGTCMNVGCVPSKFLIHHAQMAHHVRTAARFHVNASQPLVDYAAIVRDKKAMISQDRQDALQGAT